MISDLHLRWPVPDGCASAFPPSSWPCSRRARTIEGLLRSASSVPWSRRPRCCCSSRAGLRPRRFSAVRRWVLRRACFWPWRGPDSVIGDWLARPAIDREAFGSLVKLGGWQLAAQSGALIAGQADRYLLGALLQPQFVGFYTIAQRLEEAMYIGVLKVGEILFPFFSTLQKEADDRKADLLFRSSWILNVLAASALGGLIPVAGPLLHLWTGAEVAAEAQRVLVILSIAGILGSSTNVFAFYLLAQGRSSSNALISLLTGVFTLATSAIALPYFGWQAAGWSACFGMIAQMVTTMILLRRRFSLTGMWSRLIHFVLMPLGVGHRDGAGVAVWLPRRATRPGS